MNRDGPIAPSNKFDPEVLKADSKFWRNEIIGLHNRLYFSFLLCPQWLNKVNNFGSEKGFLN